MGDDFDDFGSFDSDTDESWGFSNSIENESIDDNVDSKNIKRSSIILIVVGIVIIGIVLLFARFQRYVVSKPKINNSSTSIESNNTVNNNNTSMVETNSAWIEFNGSNDIKFESGLIPTEFTIKDIKHYVLKSSDTNISVKTILIGSLKGYNGEYELEVPYNKGSKLKIGNSFSVSIELGSYKDKVVIGDIRY